MEYKVRILTDNEQVAQASYFALSTLVRVFRIPVTVLLGRERIIGHDDAGNFKDTETTKWVVHTISKDKKEIVISK